MQRRTLVSTLIVLTAICLVLLAAGGSMAAVLGNATTARQFPDTTSNFGFADVNTENPLTDAGFWQLSTWNLYVRGTMISTDEVIDLLVWRPQADPTQYQLVVRDSVTITSGVDGVQNISAGATAKTRLLQAGDVLGFYIPTGATPVITMDYYGTGGGYDPYFDNTGGGATWTDADDGTGTIVTCSTIAGIRQYSLNADILPSTATAPEPASILALVSGLAGLGFSWRRKK